MQIKLMIAILTGLFAISNSVIAEECNSRSEDSVFIMDCLSARYKAADKELNAIYDEAMKSLSSDGRQKLEVAQKAWLKYRDASMAFITEVNRKTGSTGNFIIEDYRSALVEKRAAELKYILSSNSRSLYLDLPFKRMVIDYGSPKEKTKRPSWRSTTPNE